jgi:plasmid maintenance system antidote protein VapI
MNLKKLRKHIDTYCAQNKIYKKHLSVQMGYAPNYVTNILNGYQKISQSFLTRLEVETGLDPKNYQEATNDE